MEKPIFWIWFLPWGVILFGLWYLFSSEWVRELIRFFGPQPHFDVARNKDGSFPEPPRRRLKTSHQSVMQIVISLVILAAALYVLLSREAYPDSQQKWAIGAMGTIMGFWLKR
jgi:hypothetical protein